MHDHRFPSRSRSIMVALLSVFSFSDAAIPADQLPFPKFSLPTEWQEEFWKRPAAKALLELEPRALADRVPVQSGLRFCSCPLCGADDATDPLVWDPEQPDALTCRTCKAIFADLSQPPKDKDKQGDSAKLFGEETVEVRPGVVHKYPFRIVDPVHQRRPDERAYLAARRDYEARSFLSKAAFYAAVRSQDPQPRRSGDPDSRAAYLRLACTLLIRFAQVYPHYAIHQERPGQVKVLLPANLAPPYRFGYGTGRWDYSGALEVPLNLVVAYALVRDEPALIEVGKTLDVTEPARLIENGLFRSAARFTAAQVEDGSEMDLVAARGLLAVGRLLNDSELITFALRRLERFLETGFYYDGLWRQAEASAQDRIVRQLEGWFGRLLPPELPSRVGVHLTAQSERVRRANDALWFHNDLNDVQQTAWPALPGRQAVRGPVLLGGAGVARLSVGSGMDALDLELLGVGNSGSLRSRRLAVRLAVAGQTILSDLDGSPPTPDGFDLASASHNTVVVDGLNHRETPALARVEAPGAELRYFAADPDLQLVVMEDPHAYPRSTRKYRHTVAILGGARCRYGISVFEVEGGLQHDQYWHTVPDPESSSRWVVGSGLMNPGPPSLLAPGLVYLPEARAEDGRWFVQAPGAIRALSQTSLVQPTTADLQRAGPSIRLHLLGDLPALAVMGQAPGPGDSTRPALVIRRISPRGSTLRSVFVTVFEPIGINPPTPFRVGRVASTPDTVVLLVQTAEGEEHLVFNLRPGEPKTVQLPDRRSLTTDGLLVRIKGNELALAGGEYIELGDASFRKKRIAGTITAVNPDGTLQTDQKLDGRDSLLGRTLLIRHADQTSHGWTIASVESPPNSPSRIRTVEGGMGIDPHTGRASYNTFPRSLHPGPHTFAVPRIVRWLVPDPSAATNEKSDHKIQRIKALRRK